MGDGTGDGRWEMGWEMGDGIWEMGISGRQQKANFIIANLSSRKSYFVSFGSGRTLPSLSRAHHRVLFSALELLATSARLCQPPSLAA